MKYVLKKLGFYFLVLFAVETILFLMFQVLPGNPVISKLGIENANNEVLRQNLIEEFNMNAPIGERYVDWIKNVFFLDFGNSFYYENYTVMELIIPRFFLTIQLTVLTLALSALIGIIMSTYMVLNQNKKLTTILENLIIVSISIPSFCVGILLITIFASILNIVSITNGSLFLPIVSLSIPCSALIARHLYLNFKIEFAKEYAVYAKCKGMSDFNIIKKHVFKNSLIPFFSVLITIFLSILTGSVLIENVFTLNGIGRFMVSGIKSFDYPLVQGIVFCYCIFILTISWFIDILNVIVDKRISR